MIICVALGSLTVLAPLVIYLTMQDRAAKLLADWRTWLEANNAVLTSLLLRVIAVILIGKGITGLS